MQAYNDQMDAEIAGAVMPEELKRDVVIACNDCHWKGAVAYHVFGLKCGECSRCYNTYKTGSL